jgi:drug/metabolite transporter (DMT)-like permease
LQVQLRNRRLQGYLFALLAAMCYGSASTLGKFALGSASPLTITSFGSITAGLILFPYRFTAKIERRSFPTFALVILCGSVFGPLLFYTGLRLISAVTTALLSNGELLFTSIIAIIVFKESLNRRQYAASLLVVFGIVAISTNFSFSARLLGNLYGALCVLGATLCWGIENNLARLLSQRVNTVAMARWRNFVGGLIVLAIMFLSGQAVTVVSAAIPYIILTGIIPIGFTSLLLYQALSRIGAVRTLLIFSTCSLFGTLYAYVFLSEPITSVQLLGGAILFAGIVIIGRNERTSP